MKEESEFLSASRQEELNNLSSHAFTSWLVSVIFAISVVVDCTLVVPDVNLLIVFGFGSAAFAVLAVSFSKERRTLKRKLANYSKS